MKLRFGKLASETAGRIAILAAAIVLLWVGGAVVGVLIGAYPSFGEAVWDVIWHMIDPGLSGMTRTPDNAYSVWRWRLRG